MTGKNYVYIIAGMQDGWPVAPVKVGVTKAIAGRLSQLQTGYPAELACVHAFPTLDREGAMALERAFHTIMKRYRLAGEWFDLDPLEAVLSMANNFEQMFVHHLGLEGEELEIAQDVFGVNAARKLASEAMAARDGELIRVMQ